MIVNTVEIFLNNTFLSPECKLGTAKVGYQLVTVKFAIFAFNALNDICITTYVSIITMVIITNIYLASSLALNILISVTRKNLRFWCGLL